MAIYDSAIDVHCHGVGRFDFTEIPGIQFHDIETTLSQRNHQCILTLYLPQINLSHLYDLMETYHNGRLKGLYNHIAGIALEGPVLSSYGGTPRKSTWLPNNSQWKELANLGRLGLTYIIFSPDSPEINPTKLSEILLDGGVLPSPGHFLKNNPAQSAKDLQSVFDVLRAWKHCPTMTDHMYNDMPLPFKHAWRTPGEKLKRDSEIKQLNLDSWTLNNLNEKVGPVMATMIRNAKQGLAKLSMNFDNEHVDLAVIKKTTELVGAENTLMMTDSIESQRLAGRDLQKNTDSGLLYQDEGIVAAGSRNVHYQIDNMISIGLSDSEINQICRVNPKTILDERHAYCHQTEKAA